ncbi:MAG: TIM barrel protein [candidate division WS1 bacterium]|nr:TIM barrel protein [candidate division WS1 bacterium]
MPIRDLNGQKVRRSGQELVKHLESFELDLRFTAGVWFFAPGGGRFHDRYAPDIPMEQRLEIAVGMMDQGLVGIEAHYPNEVNEDNIDLFKQVRADTGLRLITLVPNLFYEAPFEFGSLSSPIESARRAAIDRTITTLQLNIELETDFSIVWPGIDGFDNTFGQNHVAARDRFAEGLAEAMDAVPGVRICIEPKPYEPRPNIMYGTTSEALLLCQKVESLLGSSENRTILDGGTALMGLNPEVGHMLMAYEDLAYAFSLVCEYGRLGHTHWNSQPMGNYDQDLNVGVVYPEQTEAALYALKMCGFQEHFGLDLNPERMPVERALTNCMDMLKAMNDRINGLDHARIVECVENPQDNRGILEALLLRARYPEATGLTSLD